LQNSIRANDTLLADEDATLRYKNGRDNPRRAERPRGTNFPRDVHRDYVMLHCFEMFTSYKNVREIHVSKKIYVPRVTVTMCQTQF